MIVEQDEKIKFVPVRLTLETFEEFKMFTKIIQMYSSDDETLTYRFSVDIYNKLNEIHSL